MGLFFRRQSWSPEELTLLNKLGVAGASPRTAAQALNRAKETVRTKAPFKDIDDAPGDLVPALRNFLSVAIFSAYAEVLSRVVCVVWSSSHDD